MTEIKQEKKSYYAIIPANVRYDKDITPNAKLLYGEITALCNEKGFCWASNSYFAELYEVTPQAISKWINALLKKGYIKVDMIRQGKEIVQRNISIVTYQQKINKVSTEDDEGINKRLTGYQQKIKDNTTFNTTVNITKNTTDNNSGQALNITHLSKPKKSKQEKPDGVSQEIWEEYICLRKQKRAPVTSTVIKGLEREAGKAGMSLEEAMRTCIERGWQGFKAEWVGEKPKHRIASDNMQGDDYKKYCTFIGGEE